MRILFILPKFNRGNFVYDKNDSKENVDYLMPVGMPSISGSLKHAGYEVDVLNINHMTGLTEDIVKEKVSKTFYDLIFTGGLSIVYPNLRDITQYIREASPKSKIVIGGGIISAQPKIMFDLIKPDYGVIFEGEETCVELADYVKDGKDVSPVLGIVYKNSNGETIVNKSRPPVADLDSLPYPDWDGFEIEKYLENRKSDNVAYDSLVYPRPYSVVATRSCPYMCTFCFHSTGYKYRQRSIDNILEEIKWAIDKYKVNHLFFLDECFSYDKPRALEFCRRLKELYSTVPYELRMYCNLRVDCADEEIIDALKSVNCITIGLGLESHSQKVIDSMKKHITPEQQEKCLSLIASRHLNVQAGFIFGDPAETMETAMETLKFYNERQDILRGGVALDFIIPFPSTGVYRHCLKTGIIKDEVEFIKERETHPYNCFHPINMTTLSTNDFEKLKDMVFTSAYVQIRYSIPSSIKVIDGTTEVTTTCPWCKRPVVFKNIGVVDVMRMSNVLCRHEDCRGRFRIVNWRYPIIRMLVKIFGHQRLYGMKQKIFGGGVW